MFSSRHCHPLLDHAGHVKLESHPALKPNGLGRMRGNPGDSGWKLFARNKCKVLSMTGQGSRDGAGRQIELWRQANSNLPDCILMVSRIEDAR